MKNSWIENNIDFLKGIIEKRETYIRFSPLWTVIMWVMYIIYYFLWNFIWEVSCDLFSCNWFYENVQNYLFSFIWVLWVIIVCLLSLFNSWNRGELLLPKSIRHIVINQIFIGMILFSIILGIEWMAGYIIPLSFLFYWLLIIVSRFSVPVFIKYFGLVVFLSWLMILWFNPSFVSEIVLIVFWFGHLVMGWLLFKENRN